MKIIASLLLSAASILLLFSGIALAEQDKDGSKDYPLFNRLPGTYICGYEDVEFDAHPFWDEKKREINVEGHRYFFRYCYNEGVKKMSPLQILRNYESAVTKIGGVVLVSNWEETSYMKIVKNGKEIWLQVANNVGEPILHIIEKEAMKQDIVANADAFSNDIKSTGHTAIYGIYFDTGKSEIKSESDAALSEIVKLLKKEEGLKLNVVGHTDNVGGMDSNIKLSQARAEAVVQALVGKYGIAANRLTAYGVGTLAPVASNKTEDGRGKNRRVELVEQ
ncbi:MAG TPA: OmpA family protein [Nitrospirota bacterium]|nr:OmpA family protein [Nitrospirota bacterium]